MGAYESAGIDIEWYTPAYLFHALGEVFDLDVAAPKEGPLHVPCIDWFCQKGLETPWHGFVWMNPPFGHQKNKRQWLEKFFDHGHGIALLPDRTSAPWWQEAASRSAAILFVTPKIKFIRPDGTLGKSPGTGTCLLAAGERALKALQRAQPELGTLLYPHPADKAPQQKITE